MTPQDALTAALRTLAGVGSDYDARLDAGDYGHLERPHETGNALYAALPAGWRLTDEPPIEVDGIVAEMLGAESSLALAKARLRKATDTLAAQANRLRGAS